MHELALEEIPSASRVDSGRVPFITLRYGAILAHAALYHIFSLIIPVICSDSCISCFSHMFIGWLGMGLHVI